MNEYPTAPEQDVVISGRVILKRNFADLPFPHLTDEGEAKLILSRVTERIGADPGRDAYRILPLGQSEPVFIRMLTEEGLIGPGLAAHPERGTAILTTGRTISLILNDTDHIEIRSQLPGLQLERNTDMVFRQEETVTKGYAMAFDEQMGYLTAQPAEHGTGLKASAILHLPAISAAKQIGTVMQQLSGNGLSLKPYGSEHGEDHSAVFLLTNAFSFGCTEEDLVRSVAEGAASIAAREREEREKAEKTDPRLLRDRLLRSLGIAERCLLITEKEMIQRVSDLRYAAALGYLHLPLTGIDEMAFSLRRAHLDKLKGRSLTDREADELRAEALRSSLNKLNRTE